MHITANLSETTVLQELGVRFARHRRELGLTQAALAEEAGIAKRTLERIEAGYSAEFATLIRLLRVLKLADGLEGLVPDRLPSPMALLKQQGRIRQRVRPARESAPTAKNRATGRRETAVVARVAKNKAWTWNE